jgi:hypothetical protein
LPRQLGAQAHWPLALQAVAPVHVPHDPPQPSPPHCHPAQSGLQASSPGASAAPSRGGEEASNAPESGAGLEESEAFDESAAPDSVTDPSPVASPASGPDCPGLPAAEHAVRRRAARKTKGSLMLCRHAARAFPIFLAACAAAVGPAHSTRRQPPLLLPLLPALPLPDEPALPPLVEAGKPHALKSAATSLQLVEGSVTVVPVELPVPVLHTHVPPGSVHVTV